VKKLKEKVHTVKHRLLLPCNSIAIYIEYLHSILDNKWHLR